MPFHNTVTPQWHYLKQFYWKTITLRAPKQEPYYQFSRSRPKGEKIKGAEQAWLLSTTPGMFRKSGLGSRSVCAISRWPCSRIASELSWGICELPDRLWKAWFWLHPLSHSLWHKTRVHWSFRCFSESDCMGGCCQMRVTYPRGHTEGCGVTHLGSNPALPTPLWSPGQATYTPWVQIPISGMRQW